MRRISVAGVDSGPGSDGPPGRADEARTADLIAIGSHHVFTFRSQIPSDFGTALRRDLGGWVATVRVVGDIECLWLSVAGLVCRSRDTRRSVRRR